MKPNLGEPPPLPSYEELRARCERLESLWKQTLALLGEEHKTSEQFVAGIKRLWQVQNTWLARTDHGLGLPGDFVEAMDELFELAGVKWEDEYPRKHSP